MKVGDYIRINSRYENIIRKVVDICEDRIVGDHLLCLDKPARTSYYLEDEIELFVSSSILGKLLKEGDFIDNHCIVDIKDTTIYTNDGWFIDFDDLEELVTTIVTKEQFEREAYVVNE